MSHKDKMKMAKEGDNGHVDEIFEYKTSKNHQERVQSGASGRTTERRKEGVELANLSLAEANARTQKNKTPISQPQGPKGEATQEEGKETQNRHLRRKLIGKQRNS